MSVSFMSFRIVIVALCLCVAGLSGALAQGEQAPPADQARALSLKAAQAFKAKNFAEALEMFQQANALVPHPNLEVNIGRCFEALGQPEQALAHCRAALEAPNVPAPTAQAARKCVARADDTLKRPILELNTTPVGATVYIDGRRMGRTPWRGIIMPGKHVLELDLEGYAHVKKPIVAERGQTYNFKFNLDAAEQGALLTLDSNPQGAEVLLDGQPVGVTPLQGLQLESRTYQVELRRPGYAAQIFTINLPDGGAVERRTVLVPLDRRIGGAHGRPGWPGWALVGLSAVAVSVGAWSGSQALDARQDADELARTSGAAVDRAQYDSLVSDMENSRILSDAMFITAGVAAAGAVAWFLWPEGDDTPVQRSAPVNSNPDEPAFEPEPRGAW
ncbi:MAG: PEGA domain-containing protein [Bradymonadia bacterium]